MCRSQNPSKDISPIVEIYLRSRTPTLPGRRKVAAARFRPAAGTRGQDRLRESRPSRIGRPADCPSASARPTARCRTAGRRHWPLSRIRILGRLLRAGIGEDQIRVQRRDHGEGKAEDTEPDHDQKARADRQLRLERRASATGRVVRIAPHSRASGISRDRPSELRRKTCGANP